MHVGTWTAKETFQKPEKGLSLTILKIGHGATYTSPDGYRSGYGSNWVMNLRERIRRRKWERGSILNITLATTNRVVGCNLQPKLKTEARFFRLGAPRSSATGAFRKWWLWFTKLGSWLLIGKKEVKLS
jgi:hypothetical protein